MSTPDVMALAEQQKQDAEREYASGQREAESGRARMEKAQAEIDRWAAFIAQAHALIASQRAKVGETAEPAPPPANGHVDIPAPRVQEGTIAGDIAEFMLTDPESEFEVSAIDAALRKRRGQVGDHFRVAIYTALRRRQDFFAAVRPGVYKLVRKDVLVVKNDGKGEDE